MTPDARAVESVARSVLGDASATVRDWSVTRLGSGASEALGQSDGLLRVSGTARTAAGDRAWSTVVKTIRRVPIEIGGLNPDIDDPNHSNYWRREADAFASGALSKLGGGLSAPRYYRLDTDESGHEVTLWMEDIKADDDSTWSLERYWTAARHLGTFNGRFVGLVPDSVRPWAARGRLQDWLVTGAIGVRQMASATRSGLLGTWLSDDSVARIGRLYDERARLLRLLEPLPETFCHHDAHRRNLMSVGRGSTTRTVAVDWAMAGTGRLGEDLAVFMGVPLQFLDVPMTDRVEFEAAVIDGYVTGLRVAGWTGDEGAIRLGYKAALSLFMGVAVAGTWFSTLSDPAAAGFPEHIIGRPYDEIGEQWAEMQPYLLDLGEEALLSA